MIGTILQLVNPLETVLNKVTELKLKRLEAESDSEKIQIEAELEALEVRKQVLIAEQSNPITRWMRPLWALPFILYTWKIVVYDKILKLGVTEPLDDKMWGAMMLILGAYFTMRGIDKIVTKIWR